MAPQLEFIRDGEVRDTGNHEEYMSEYEKGRGKRIQQYLRMLVSERRSGGTSLPKAPHTTYSAETESANIHTFLNILKATHDVRGSEFSCAFIEKEWSCPTCVDDTYYNGTG